ncbi:MAG: isoleucyl-tRNA synthetase [Verrucomicrobiales bacterium]|jgi:isoleucyl-tRNA synthetase
MSDKPKSYKDTLNLPDTEFPMRGDLVKREPLRLEKWEAEKLYQQIDDQRKAEGAPTYILHDGPPFANGDVHMGTALNKVLKDLVVKSKTMAGFRSPYIPGWDCHGLPIEFKVVKETRGLEPAEIRTRAEKFARKYIDIQRNSFRRLGVFGDWDNPYLTLSPEYEADIIRVFAKLVEKGLIYQSRKPVSWSFGAKTALAEAEVEYENVTDTAVFVKFPIVKGKLAGETSLVIWTTTPWTLPANLGVALHPRFDYVRTQFETEEGRVEDLVIAESLLEKFESKTGFKPKDGVEITKLKGSEFDGSEAQHPFLDQVSKVINGDFVDDETGTGAVHIAPGHGAIDYAAGQAAGLGVVSPVDDDGNFTDEVGLPQLVGKHVLKANDEIVEMLAENGTLIGRERYKHSYPHCWRSKTPIIFRSIEQFFIKIDALRETALKEIDEVEWLPHWGRNRIRGTVESRPDWCISRQRTWGVPLPVFFLPDGKVKIDAEIARKVAEIIEEGGTNVWFEWDDATWAEKVGLPEGSTRCKDTLDVWIDSGSSHVAVLDRHPELSTPADLYLEATDQHRGWFQSSLMMSVGYRGSAPYKTVMTHGFVVRRLTKGERAERKKLGLSSIKTAKISKSDEKKGKPMDAKHFYDQFGADILRLWVSTVDWQNEVPFSEDIFKDVADAYRRFRNSLRILLANLSDFDPDKDAVGPDKLTTIDRWILQRLNQVVTASRAAYEAFDFRKVFNELNNFCAVDLSALYVDITKDRMYCDAVDSPRRRATQTVMHTVFDALTRLLAPILAYTADEAWEYAGSKTSVHLTSFPEPDPDFAETDAIDAVQQLLRIRDAAQARIDESIKAGSFKKRERAAVTIALKSDDSARPLLADARDDAMEFLMLSDYDLAEGDSADLAVEVRETEHPECPRCRRSIPLASEELCERCDSVVVGAG